jgi:LmbE family N-acetylglucosaminyl deacetylase
MTTTFAPPLLVISPHLDDAVFACGEALYSHPGALVATLFAGGPGSGSPPTPWDLDAGFLPGDDVMARRREEDLAALDILAARPVWLPFLDRQYLRRDAAQDGGSLHDAVFDLLQRCSPPRALVPLGLFHSDHERASNAALGAAARLPGIRCTAYEDALYRRLPGAVQQRLRCLQERGWEATPVELPGGHLARKRAAVACYASQLRALATVQRLGHADAFARERYWDLRFTRDEPCR